MVQFGKTLNDVVKSDWRCHAVAYMELKRALSESHKNNNGDNNDEEGTDKKDDDSVHTESSYVISDKQKANFFRIYEGSIVRLTNFYENRVEWAQEERGRLEKAVERNKNHEGSQQSGEGNAYSGESSTSSTSFLVHRINNFSKDLGLAIEFLELNCTAFSKIMKKYDKRTGSDLRESKLKELKADHPYLYDGGELKKCKKLCAEWTKELHLVLQQDVSTIVGHLGGGKPPPSPSKTRPPSPQKKRNSREYRDTKNLHGRKPSSDSGSVRLTRSNSIDSGDAIKIAKSVQAEVGENPQESSEQIKSDATTPVGREVRFTESTKKEGVHLKQAHRSIHKTKEAQILEQMIDRVNEELCYQKADSPFFDKALDMDKPQPPSFMSSEVQFASMLGQGEFCKIYEVSQFNVPESCHICFLHRGYNDKPQPKQSLKAPSNTDAATHRKIPSSVMIGVSDPMALNALSDATQAVTAEKWTAFDDEISDYESLEEDHEDDGYEHTTRGFMKEHCLRNGEARYAIKRIRSCLVGEEEITDAAIDLAREAEFLAALVHPNIIRIRGTINVPGHPKYAIILDRLYDTLEVKMLKWKAEAKRYQGKFKGLIGKDKKKLKNMWTQRLVAAYDLARAMAYIHSRGILHRDIKPQNIGFDIRGDIKIFDFGLAKELKPCDREGKDQFRTSGLAGTRRYMAPEVAQVMPYGFSSDVFSFCILLWEMLTLKAAFEHYTREKHYKDVIVEGKRPKVSKSWPFVIQDLLNRGWAKQPTERPTFQAVCELIKFGLPSEMEASERSDDLLLRSFRSTGRRDSEIAVEQSAHDPNSSNHSNVSNHIISESHSDSLSQSVHVKSKNLHKLRELKTTTN